MIVDKKNKQIKSERVVMGGEPPDIKPLTITDSFLTLTTDHIKIGKDDDSSPHYLTRSETLSLIDILKRWVLFGEVKE